MKTHVILELIGLPQTGKTTLAEQLVNALSPASMLLIDASSDQRLTQTMAFEPPGKTLAQALGNIDTRPGQSREAIDWAFQELPTAAGQDVEVLVVGALPATLEHTQMESLRYGLPRLLRAYEVVIIDGFHPLIDRLLPEELLIPLLLTTPQQDYRYPEIPDSRTPALLINRSHNGDLSPALEQALEARELRLVGKIPDYPDPDERIRCIGEDFHNCLLRMNLPVSLNP